MLSKLTDQEQRWFDIYVKDKVSPEISTSIESGQDPLDALKSINERILNLLNDLNTMSPSGISSRKENIENLMNSSQRIISYMKQIPLK